jgi:hypothetical protein
MSYRSNTWQVMVLLGCEPAALSWRLKGRSCFHIPVDVSSNAGLTHIAAPGAVMLPAARFHAGLEETELPMVAFYTARNVWKPRKNSL